MLRLTNEAFEDNATVRVVTLVTLIYLPASFISVSMLATPCKMGLTLSQTVLGMNLFNFDDATGNFVISGQFWIFVVLAVPLTLLTLGTWYVFTRRRRKQQRKRMLEEENEELDEKESLGEYAV